MYCMNARPRCSTYKLVFIIVLFVFFSARGHLLEVLSNAFDVFFSDTLIITLNLKSVVVNTM